MKTDAIFEGGGVRGIGFAGAVSCLESRGYEFQRLAGTSAGAVMAALLAVGYTGEELSMMTGTDFSGLLGRDLLQSIPLLGGPLGLAFEKGLYQADRLEEWVQGLLEAKGKTRFGDVMLEGECRLKIIASDITKKKIMILPDVLPEYGFDPMEFEIAKAVRMSASIPLFFSPEVICYRRCEHYIVDGGVLSNYPIWIFDVKGRPRWPTFGFKLVNGPVDDCPREKTDLYSYVFDILGAMIDEDQSVFMRNKDSVRTVTIPTLGVKATDFDLSPTQSFKLYQSGYVSCQRFLKSWNFEDYVRKYRKELLENG